MKMVAHKTEVIYRRYAIADESMLRGGAAKLEALFEAQRGAPPVVVPLRTGKVMAKSNPGERRARELSAVELGDEKGGGGQGRD